MITHIGKQQYLFLDLDLTMPKHAIAFLVLFFQIWWNLDTIDWKAD